MKCRKGQSMIEYVIAFSALLVVVAAVWKLIEVSEKYSARSVALVSSEYP